MYISGFFPIMVFPISGLLHREICVFLADISGVSSLTELLRDDDEEEEGPAS